MGKECYGPVSLFVFRGLFCRFFLSLIARPDLVLFAAGSMAAAFSVTWSVADAVLATFDVEEVAVDEGLGQFFAGFEIDALDGASGNVHLVGTFLLGVAFKVNQADGFVFIDGHLDDLLAFCPAAQGAEPAVFGESEDISQFYGSCHD